MQHRGHHHHHSHGEGHSHEHGAEGHHHHHSHDIEDSVPHTHNYTDTDQHARFLKTWREKGYERVQFFVDEYAKRKAKGPEGEVLLTEEQTTRIVKEEQKKYDGLQDRLDRNVVGAPNSEALMVILKLLCTPSEAGIARRMPTSPEPLRKIAKRLDMPESELKPVLDNLCAVGLVIDFHHKGEVPYYSLAPVVVGFFEFTFMRSMGKDELEFKQLSDLFEEYIFKNPEFGQAMAPKGAPTALARTCTHEEHINMDEHEVLDYEKATMVLKDAEQISVSHCTCRTHKKYIGEGCDGPIEVCFSFGRTAEFFERQGWAKLVSTEEALEILENCKEHGLVQIADNVREKVGFMCNCCKCCCGFIQGAKTYDLTNLVMPSNFVAKIDEDCCIGCGACVEACPMEAMKLDDDTGLAVNDAELCLGCGVCVTACDQEAISMDKRKGKRIYTPKNITDRYLRMAVERGKLADLIFSDPESISYRTLGRLIKVLERSPVGMALRAIEPLKSVFLNSMLKVVERTDLAHEKKDDYGPEQTKPAEK